MYWIATRNGYILKNLIEYEFLKRIYVCVAFAAAARIIIVITPMTTSILIPPMIISILIISTGQAPRGSAWRASVKST
jgi:hypothetical protein